METIVRHLEGGGHQGLIMLWSLPSHHMPERRKRLLSMTAVYAFLAPPSMAPPCHGESQDTLFASSDTFQKSRAVTSIQEKRVEEESQVDEEEQRSNWNKNRVQKDEREKTKSFKSEENTTKQNKTNTTTWFPVSHVVNTHLDLETWSGASAKKRLLAPRAEEEGNQPSASCRCRSARHG